MDHCALFVDAGYLLAEGGALCCGTKRRGEFLCDYAALTRELAYQVKQHSDLTLLRIYWYDAAPHAMPTYDHLTIGRLSSVKLRLGRLSGGEQKGVDALIYRDLMTLARERAMATAYVVSGDEDLREGVIAAQDMGVRVVLVGVPVERGNNQADTLIREADEHIVLAKPFWEPFFSKPTATESKDTATASRVGSEFAAAWAEQTNPQAIRQLLREAPRIPSELDVQLLRAGETKFGPLREQQDLRAALRGGFWTTIREVSRSLPPAGGVPG